MSNLSPILLRDFRNGRITPETLAPYLIPQNSVKDSLNVNYDEIVGLGKVRAGTTEIGTGQEPGADGFFPMGLFDFSPGSGAQLGEELITNGSFTGNADGWTLGDGWTYNSNNVLWTGLGNELITNGTFTGSAVGWSLGTGWTYGGNKVTTDGTLGGSLNNFPTYFLWKAGVRYRFTFDVSGSNGGFLLVQAGSLSPFTQIGAYINDSYSYDFQNNNAALGGCGFAPNSSGTPFIGSIDNVSIKEILQGSLSQDIGAIIGQSYLIEVTAGGSTGYVTVALGDNSFIVAAGETVSQIIAATSLSVSITASSDFNGTVDDVSIKQELSELLLVVYNGVSTATLYSWNGTAWTTSNLTTLTNDKKNRFTALGARAFLSNSVDGMYSSPDGITWSQGASNECIDKANATPNLLFRYKQRLLAAGDPTYPDRVFFSSIISPVDTPFITWNTDASTGDWIDVNPDDGGNITGFSENSTFCMVFKNTGMYRLDTVAKTVDPDNIYNVGAVSQEAITLCQGVTYFFSGTGIYRTNGGYPELISRNGVQDIIDALDASNWPTIASGTDGFNVYFEIGQVTLHENQTNQRILNNVVLKFSVRDQSWSVHDYRDYFGMFAQYTDGNGQLLRGASDAGIVQTIDLGTTDAQGSDVPTAIPFFLETQDVDCGDRSHLKGISDKIAVFTDNGLSSTFAARSDGNDTPFPILMTLSKRVNVGTNINLQGNFFNFIWSGTSSGNPPIFEGIYCENITDQGMGDAQGESQAPIVTTPLQ